MKKGLSSALRPRFRVMSGETIALGPGKIQILRHLVETGSLNQAAACMDMSYMRAWNLVQTMNDSFKSPLVSLARGGPKGGGAKLTPLGTKVLQLYLEMEESSLRACAPAWVKLRRQLKSR